MKFRLIPISAVLAMVYVSVSGTPIATPITTPTATQTAVPTATQTAVPTATQTAVPSPIPPELNIPEPLREPLLDYHKNEASTQVAVRLFSELNDRQVEKATTTLCNDPHLNKGPSRLQYACMFWNNRRDLVHAFIQKFDDKKLQKVFRGEEDASLLKDDDKLRKKVSFVCVHPVTIYIPGIQSRCDALKGEWDPKEFEFKREDFSESE